MKKRPKEKGKMTHVKHPGALGEDIEYKDFFGPSFGIAVESLVDSLLPDSQSLQEHITNVIILRQKKEDPINFLHAKDLRFKSGEKVLFAAIVEELQTVDLSLISLDLTASHANVKIYTVFNTIWSDGYCTLGYRVVPERGKWQFSIDRNRNTLECDLDALFARSFVMQVIRHTAMTTNFLLGLK